MASRAKSLVLLTGAGISAESGLKTFRDHDGLWEGYSPEEVASIDAFRRDPELVQRFYNERRAQLQDPKIRPNAAHIALAELERKWSGEFLLITQNVDDLHDRAGSKHLLHMHGELLKVRCQASGAILPWRNNIESDTLCPCCQKSRTLRPHIVWFGEMPLEMDRCFKALSQCDVFVAIGTSGHVYPAASFVQQVRRGAHTLEMNKEPSLVAGHFAERRMGPASEVVPAWVAEMLAAVS